jgi:hypothetical protein
MDPKSEFENTTGGYIGVQAKKPDGTGFNGIAVRPNGRVWLDEEEQIATANAPRDDANNPFENGNLKLVTPAKEIANRRKIGDTEKPQVTGASDAPAEEKPVEDAPAPPPEEDVEATEAAKAAKEKAAREEEAKAKQKERAEAEESARQAAARGRARQAPQETGATKAPTGTAPEGSRSAGEEVGTPEAPQKA